MLTNHYYITACINIPSYWNIYTCLHSYYKYSAEEFNNERNVRSQLHLLLRNIYHHLSVLPKPSRLMTLTLLLTTDYTTLPSYLD